MAVTIETYTYSDGKLKEQVLEFITRPDGSVLVSYVSAEYPNGYRRGKQNEAILSTDNPVVVIDHKGRQEFHGDVDAVLSAASSVEGKTYEIKEKIKSFGFAWDGSAQRWVAPVVAEANKDNFKPTRLPDDAFRYIEKNHESAAQIEEVEKAVDWISDYFDMHLDDTEEVMFWDGKNTVRYKSLKAFEESGKAGVFILSDENKIELYSNTGGISTLILKK